MAQRWYALEAQSDFGGVAAQHLQREAVVHYQPLMREWRVRRGQRVAHASPLFPGYLFVWLEIADLSWRCINRMPGVVKLLPRYKENPDPLPWGFVEDLQALQSDGALDEPDAEAVVARYGQNEVLRIESGPFQGHAGRYAGRRKGQVVLLLSLLGRETELRLPPHQVARA